MPTRPTPAPAARSDPQFANTLERGLRVLQCFSANAPDLGNREIAEMTGLPKPTVSRLTYTLMELGYLRRRPDSARFEVGNGVLCLGYPVLARLAFKRVAIPHMRHLALEIDGTVSVSVRDRLRMVTLETYTKRDVMRRRPATGVTLDFVGTATGMGWMVGATSSERDRALREVAHHLPDELDRFRADFDAGLTQLARQGYIMRRGSIRADTSSLATPVRRRPGDELLVLVCALNTPQPHTESLEQRAGGLLLEAARHISEELLAS